MKCTSFLVFAAIAFSAVHAVHAAAASSPATGNLRGLQSGPEMVDFAAVNQVASFNALHAGEEILQAVNDAFPNDAKVNGDQLLTVAKRIANKDNTLSSADAATQDIVAAIRKAFEKLFPGEAFDTALTRVLTKLPEPAAHRRLSEPSQLV